MKDKFIDKVVFRTYWLLIWIKVIRVLLTKNPVSTIRIFKDHPWIIPAILNINKLYRYMCRNRTGRYLKANALVVNEMTACLLNYFGSALYNPDNVILTTEIISPEIFHAMGFAPFAVEVPSLLLPLLEPYALTQYIDTSENYGIPSDICSLLKGTMGMILEKQLMSGHAVIATNLPCDTHLCTNTLLESEIDTPFFRLDAPYDFTTDSATDYFVEELKGMISWLESTTGHRMDWDKLRQICIVRNRWVELQSEYWDTLRVKPAPMSGEAGFLPYWFVSILRPGSKRNITLFEKLFELSRQNMEQEIAAVPNEKFRVLIWNMPIFHFFEVFSWAEETWGVSFIAEGLSFNRIPFIDIKTNESMLRGVAKLILYAPMARHSRGPVENYLDDLFFAYKIYNMDMIWVGSNIGCKKTMALSGILREQCRKAGIPILNINMEILDPRAINHNMIKEQINQFMENTMKAKRFCSN